MSCFAKHTTLKVLNKMMVKVLDYSLKKHSVFSIFMINFRGMLTDRLKKMKVFPRREICHLHNETTVLALDRLMLVDKLSVTEYEMSKSHFFYTVSKPNTCTSVGNSGSLIKIKEVCYAPCRSF